ncbi:MAG TPA: hypothetical protein PLD68_02655 [Clostridiales bacterium]|nr:hypothetical protein [Clostridiales bacterium]
MGSLISGSIDKRKKAAGHRRQADETAIFPQQPGSRHTQQQSSDKSRYGHGKQNIGKNLVLIHRFHLGSIISSYYVFVNNYLFFINNFLFFITRFATQRRGLPAAL